MSGVVVGAVLGSILMFVVSVAPSEKLHGVVWWLLGSLQVFDWGLLRVVSAVVAAGLVVSVLFSRDLNLMALGEEPAAHLGLNVEWTRKLFFLVASLMTGATVAACGLIGFVGLIVPHSVRLAVGPDHRRLVAASAMAGAAFLVLADSVARTIDRAGKSRLASSPHSLAARSFWCSSENERLRTGTKMLSLKDVSAGYGGKPFCGNIAMHVAGGEFVGLIGPNGSGKTTLLRVISGVCCRKERSGSEGATAGR